LFRLNTINILMTEKDNNKPKRITGKKPEAEVKAESKKRKSPMKPEDSLKSGVESPKSEDEDISAVKKSANDTPDSEIKKPLTTLPC
jgi:hypothetical protein